MNFLTPSSAVRDIVLLVMLNMPLQRVPFSLYNTNNRMENSMEVLKKKKLKLELQYDPAIPLLRIT